ncbi:MAG: sigma 54-interacting transcriptional regulator [Proteobacteria bacterium]|nr:sigma 54-interacting transcriptional regulator [Cystobacterineae bacterium]MCL2258938.1 sigma 54-interacting transcriptional regulator [Cystobacterineae bacterium]MCL2313907.1 sigma 54-interacting transcriptional regulator [Pseudomonadota bacterium]
MKHQGTEPIQHLETLLRYDRTTDTLRERRYQIAVIAGPDTGRLAYIEGRLTVGSRPGVGLRLKDNTVSRHHFELLAKPEGILIRDLDSTNGTWLAGARIREVVIAEEAVVTIGKTSLRISIQEENLGQPKATSSFGKVLGSCPTMQSMFGLLERVSKASSTVLLAGEPGTGKSLVAQSIHENSARANKPFVAFHCSSTPMEDLDAELFGRVASPHQTEKTGALLNAAYGTLYLNEIDALPKNTQLRLLNFFENGNTQKLGADKTQRVDVRIIAATQKDLEAEVAAEKFSQELLLQLAVIRIQIPPLRERLEDIPLLAQEFVRLMGRGDFELPRGLMARFGTYDWPGNVQELRNLVERALAGADADPLPGQTTPRKSPRNLETETIAELPFKEAKERLVDSFTREYLMSLYERCEGNISRMAREAGIARNYVHRLVTKYGLKPAQE